MCGGIVLWNVSQVTYCGAVLTFPGAKRLECVELAPAFGAATLHDSARRPRNTFYLLNPEFFLPNPRCQDFIFKA